MKYNSLFDKGQELKKLYDIKYNEILTIPSPLYKSKYL